MHRRKNNPSTVTKKPRVSASGGIVATAISVVAVMTAAVNAGTSAVAVEEGGVAMIAARVVTETDVIRGMGMVTDAIRAPVTFRSRQRGCASRSLPQWKRYISW
jgi:hypothetical protein